MTKSVFIISENNELNFELVLNSTTLNFLILSIRTRTKISIDYTKLYKVLDKYAKSSNNRLFKRVDFAARTYKVTIYLLLSISSNVYKTLRDLDKEK